MQLRPMTMGSTGGGLPTEDINERNSSIGSQNPDSGMSPHASSVEDYNRVMLRYTQKQMAAFANNDASGERRNSGTSGTSGSSGGYSQSNASSVSNLARTGGGPPPPRSVASNRS